jgi:hypothetical protein
MPDIKVNVAERNGSNISWPEENNPATDILAMKGIKSPNELELGDQNGVVNLSQIRDRAAQISPIAFDNSPTAFVFTDDGSGEFSITSGGIWEGLTRNAISAFDTTGSDTFTYVYRDGVGGHTQVFSQSAINNLQYDNGSGSLVAVTGGNFVNHWVYIDKADQYFVVYGQAQYGTSAEALDESAPTDVPASFSDNAKLRFQIVQQQGASSFDSVVTVSDRGPAGPQGPIGLQGLPGLSYEGLWSAGLYTPGQVVTYDAGDGIRAYVCTAVTTGNEAPTVTFNWDLLSEKGKDGADGFGLNGTLLGTAWDSGTTYAADDIIEYNGSLYLSLQGSNLNQVPETQTAFWGLLVAKGVDGAPAGQNRHYSRYSDTASAGITTGVVNIDFNIESFKTVPEIFTYSAGEFTCTEEDRYLINYKVGFAVTTGTAFTSGRVEVQVDTGSGYSTVTDGTSYVFLYTTGVNASLSGVVIVDLAVGDKVRLIADRPFGATTIQYLGDGSTSLSILSATGKGDDGAPGLPGTGTYQETWSSGVTYAVNDFVRYNGAIYASKQNGNLNQQPDLLGAWWAFVIQDGDPGADGADGAPAGQTRYWQGVSASPTADITTNTEYITFSEDIFFDPRIAAVSGTEITFQISGVFQIAFNGNGTETAGGNRVIGVCQLELDSGSGYVAQSNLLGKGYMRNTTTNAESMSFVGLLDVSAGDKIRVAAYGDNGATFVVDAGATIAIISATGKGEDGAPGTPGNGNWRGDWLAGTTYPQNDLVRSSNAVWVSLQAANTGNDPATSPAWWDKLIEDGVDGQDGQSVTFTEVSGTATVSTTSTTYVTVPDCSFTILSTGRYKIEFSSSARHLSGTNNGDGEYGIFVDGTLVQRSHRNNLWDSGNTNTDTRRALHSMCVVNLTAGQVVDVRWQTSDGSFEMFERNMILTKA